MAKKKSEIIYETTLNNEQVDEISLRVRDFLKAHKVEKRDITRYAMSVEEILLKSQTVGESKTVRLYMGKKFMRLFVTVEIDGKAQNLYIKDASEKGVYGNYILKNLGLSPEYSYAPSGNTYNFRIHKKRMNPFLVLIISLACAFAVGFLGLLIDRNTCNVILESVIVPLQDTFFNILGCIAGPMVFLSVAWGIYGIGDAATLKQVGRNIMAGYIGTVYAVEVIFCLFMLPFFSLNYTTAADSYSGMLSSIFNMLLGIVPSNIFSPFVDGNTLQIIFLAVVIGIAMLFLGQKTTAVARAVEQINYIVQFLIEFISKLVPFFIFIVVVKIIWSDTAKIFANASKMLIVFIAVTVSMSLCVILYTSIRNRVNPVTLLKNGLPVLVIALTTASSAAAFGMNISTSEKNYGIDNTVTSFGIPLGMVTFKPTTALGFTAATLFFAEIYNVEVSLTWVLVLMFTAGILAVATPPIPGGALTAYTVLFTQLGIPVEALAIALACDTLFDAIETGVDQFLLPLALIRPADKLGMLNRDIMESKN